MNARVRFAEAVISTSFGLGTLSQSGGLIVSRPKYEILFRSGSTHVTLRVWFKTE